MSGLIISVTAMVMNFMGKSKKGGGNGHSEMRSNKEHGKEHEDEEMQKIIEYQEEEDSEIELSRK